MDCYYDEKMRRWWDDVFVLRHKVVGQSDIAMTSDCPMVLGPVYVDAEGQAVDVFVASMFLQTDVCQSCCSTHKYSELCVLGLV